MRLKIRLYMGLLILISLFQNCSNFKSTPGSSINAASQTAPGGSQGDSINGTTDQTSSQRRACSFNSLTVQDGQTVPGYLYGNATQMNATCAAIASTRSCSDGTLSGDSIYQYEHCVDSTSCRAPRHYTYTLGSAVALNCITSVSTNSGFIPLFQVSIPDLGKAIAHVKLNLTSSGSIADYWAAYAFVGVTATDGQAGDDICPGHTVSGKSVIASGTLSSGYQTVQVYAAQGADECVNGEVTALAGATLDVWVEDPAAQCQGQDIGIVDNTNYFVWPTSVVPVASLSIPATTSRSQLTVISSAEGTPLQDPNKVCGQEAATLVAQTVAGSSVNSVTGVVTASGGMGHLLLGPELDDVPYSSATMTSAVLNVGSNFSSSVVFSGGPTSGGSILAFIKH